MLNLKKHDILNNLERTSTNNASITGDYPYENDYIVLRDRDGDPIPDDLDAYILRDCPDIVADHSHDSVPAGFACSVPDYCSSRRHGRVHSRSPLTPHRNLRVRSPHDNHARPSSPDVLYRLVIDNLFSHDVP
ncbi:unnamed protein product [Rotaria sp. Silwood1]|nr:unnamed protein product [Rotaria sp. Silwood1]CAF1662690.1 unnamed protein product [Rotaria sp. Silwood1]